MKYQILIDSDGHEFHLSALENGGPMKEGDTLLMLVDAVAHVGSHIATNHNCDDKNCELQKVATHISNGIIEVMKPLERKNRNVKRQDT